VRKFKAGDKIELVNTSGKAALAGATAIVQDPPYAPSPYALPSLSPTLYLQIKWERNALSGNQSDGGYHEGDFALIERARFVTAWQNETGDDFMFTGHEFSEQRHADAHANELAADNSGATVLVLRAVSKHSSRTVVTSERM
jgi:hypothetical protein